MAVQKAREPRTSTTDEEWYKGARPTYEALSETVKRLLEGLLDANNINYLSVDARAKDVDSFLKKRERKAYKNPRRDIHDLAGIRVIAYTESDVTRINEIIAGTFNVHAGESLDKAEELGVDRAGYRSVHFVCDLGTARTRLAEYKPYGGIRFEIQVRTVLQHAWAEIEHDRNYKFAGVLPTPLQRRLYLAAGTLEMVDREFDAIARDVDAYAADIDEATRRGELEIPLNTTSLAQFLETKYSTIFDVGRLNIGEVVLSELSAMGIDTLAGVEALMTDDFCALEKACKGGGGASGLLRDAMAYSDPERFFRQASQQHFNYIPPDTLEILTSRYDPAWLNTLLDEVGVKHPPLDGDELSAEPTRKAL
jgi:putative GTP pyrophosphokinase